MKEDGEEAFSQEKAVWSDFIYIKHPKLASIYIGSGSRVALVEGCGQKGMGTSDKVPLVGGMF